MAKNTVCYSIENSYANQLKILSKLNGPSQSRIVEKAVEDYLKNSNLSDAIPDEEKKQLSFYPTDETLNKLKIAAQVEGRSVSNLVSYIIKKFILEINKDE
jgi:predicted DNA-binding protein